MVVDSEQRKGVQSVELGARLLDALARAGKALPLKILAADADMSPSTAHRYLASFVRAGLVRQDAVSGRYDLGEMALRVGLAAMQRLDYVQVTGEAAQSLADRLEQTALVAIWSEHGPITIRWHNGLRPIFTVVGLGSRLPVVQSAPGRVFAAHMPSAITAHLIEQELEGALQPPYTVEAFEKELQQVRKSGFSLSDGKVTPGLRVVTAPVFNFQNQIVAALSLLSTSHTLIEAPNRYVDELLKEARLASERLGCTLSGV